MLSIPALTGRESLTPQASKATSELQPSPQLNSKQPSKIEQRVAQLQKDTLQMAQDFLGQFASQLFGDAANGMKVSFDQMELNTSSEASMSLSSSRSNTSSTQSATFSLNDSSSFTGRGTLTTADGRQFEFELSVSYESRQATSYTQQFTRNNTSGTPTHANPSEIPNKAMNYQGTADDLLSSISADPVRLPFKLKDQDNKDQAMGDLVLKLLKLNGGDRFYDWFGPQGPKIDQAV